MNSKNTNMRLPDRHAATVKNEDKATAMACALRDFFLAKNCQELERALLLLGYDQACGIELEYEFNRLFTGPAPPEAPPWASVYLEREAQLMGDSTLFMRSLLTVLGLAAPSGYPDDWLPFELELWLILANIEEEENNIARLALGDRLLTHMRVWLPLFMQRAREASESHAINFVISRLEEWLISTKE